MQSDKELCVYIPYHICVPKRTYKAFYESYTSCVHALTLRRALRNVSYLSNESGNK